MFSLRSTTATIACAALAVPGTAVSQGNGQGLAKGLAKQLVRESGFEMCGATPQPPCVSDDAFLVVELDTDGLPQCDAETPAPCVTESGYVKVLGDSELARQAIANLQAPLQSASEPAASDEAAPTGDAAADNGDAVGAVEEAGASDEVQADEQAVVEAEPPDTPPSQDAAEGEEPTAETLVLPTESEPVTDAGDGMASDIADDTAATSVTAPDAERTETDVADIEEAPAAAAAADEEATGEVVVDTEEVTEETARSASEDFETTATGEATADAEVSAERDGGGLSNFEKALLVGLGAVAVGSILNNGDEVVSNSGDRIVLRDNEGDLRVLKNDDALLRQPGSEVRTETFSDGSTRTTVDRDDGTRIVTIRAADGRVVRRVRVLPDGRRIVLIDDTEEAAPVRVTELPEPRRQTLDVDVTDEDALRLALADARAERLDRRFSLRQIRQIEEVRELAPQIELDAVTFATASAAIQPSQAEELAALGRAMVRIIDERPGEVFLIEGHTDAVGDASYNLALSDRRAETVALALTEYFGVPPENMVTQGYGEAYLKVPTLSAERANRRATVRRITPLLGMAAAN